MGIVITDEPSENTDLNTAITNTQTPPEVAAKNIERSKLFDVSPDTYDASRKELDVRAAELEDDPGDVGEMTKDFALQSQQHTSLASKDLASMSWIERKARNWKEDIIDVPSKRREINELISEKMSNKGVLPEDKEAELVALNAEMQQMQSNTFGEEIGTGEQLTLDVLSGLKDMAASYWENKELLGGVGAAGAAIGAAAGFFAPVPGGTIVGLKAGLASAAPAGMALVGLLDGYTQASRGMYNELTYGRDEEGNPYNLDHDRKDNISMGVGAVVGIAEGVAGKTLASGNSFLKRFASPKKAAGFLAKSPALLAKLDILGALAKSALAEGGAEGLQEFSSAFAENFAQTDGSESALNNSIDAFTETWNVKTLKRVGYSATVGAVTGGVASAATSIPGYEGLRDNYVQIQEVAKQKQETLKNQNNLLEIAGKMKETGMDSLAPEEMNKFVTRVFEQFGVGTEYFLEMDDLRKFANDPEKGNAVRNAIDPSGKLTQMAQELGTPVKIEAADALKIIKDFPEFTDFMRMTPESENPFEVRREAKNFVENLKVADQRRQEILNDLNVADGITPEIQARIDQMMEPVKDSKFFENREQYLGNEIFRSSEGLFTEKQAQAFNDSHAKARAAIDQAIVDKVDSRFNKYEDAQVREESAIEIQRQIGALEKEFKVIDNFTAPVDRNSLEPRTANTAFHKKKGYSGFAIDPKWLTEDLKEIYLGNENLAKRKVFVEGGITPEEAAALNGVETPLELLRMLAETPTKKEVVNRIKNDKQFQAQKKKEANSDLKETRATAIDEAFSQMTNVHLQELKFMKAKQWSTMKRGVIKLAGKIPTAEALNQQAKADIAKLKIRDINPAIFERGQRKAQKASLENWMNSEIEQAFDNTIKAAQNNEARKEAVKALDVVERSKSFWKKAKKETAQQELRDAGVLDAFNEYMSLFKLDGNLTNQTEQASFNKFVNEQKESGNFFPAIPEIPDRLKNTQMSYKDLTLEQFKAITDMGEYMLHVAKTKNKLREVQGQRKELRTAERIAQEIEKSVKDHPNFDPKQALAKEAKTVIDVFKQGIRSAASSISSIKSAVFELDNYKLDGFFAKTILDPLKTARTNKRTEIRDIEAADKKMMEAFYGDSKNFAKQFNKEIVIPEFADFPQITGNNETVTRSNLLTMLAYTGDPDGRESLTNYTDSNGNKISLETIQKVLDRELDSNDAAFVQNFMIDRFKRFEKRSFDLHKRTTGLEPEMIKGSPFIHKGKVYPGGYFPIFRQILSDDVKAANMLTDLKDKVGTIFGTADEEGYFQAKLRTAEMTQQGRLKERTGSQRALDLNFTNILDATEESVHDLNFREVGIDLMKIMKDPNNVKNMKSVLGVKKYVSLLNHTKDSISKSSDKEFGLFKQQNNWFRSIINKGNSLHAMQYIGFSLRSVLVQPDSLSNVMLNVSPKSGKYLASHIGRIAANPELIPQYIELAKTINPDIGLEQDGIDNAVLKRSYDWIPSDKPFFGNYIKNKKLKKLTDKVSVDDKYIAFREMQKSFQDTAFAGVRGMDMLNKVLLTNSLGEQFLNGDIPGFDADKVNLMSEAEKSKTMQRIIRQASDLSLTDSSPEGRSALEKDPTVGIFIRYWTDRRAKLNTILAQVDKAKGAVRKGDNTKAANQLMWLSLATGLSSAWIAAIRDEEESIVEQLKGIKDEDDVTDFVLGQAWNFIKAPLDQTIDTIPIVDSMKYAAERAQTSKFRTNAQVSIPFLNVASQSADFYNTLEDILYMGAESIKKGKNRIDLDQTDRKRLLTGVGYMIGGAPTNAIDKAINALSENKSFRSAYKYVGDAVDNLHNTIEKYINTLNSDPNLEKDKDAQEFIEDLKEIQAELPRQTEESLENQIPEGTQELIKDAVSGGDWSKVDEETGAAGIYQFTEERWNQIAAADPLLGLTENGRLAKNSKQQEKAMDWAMVDNTRTLRSFDVEVNQETLLGAHQFGAENMALIYTAKDNDKLSEVIGADSESPIFKKFNTVGSIKRYLSGKVKQAK